MKKNHYLFAKEKLILITFMLIGFVLLIPSTSCKKDFFLNHINPWNDGNDNCPTCGGTVKDVDGNTYRTVQIGTQCWMAENLRTTKFNDSTPIPLVTSFSQWAVISTPGYCWFNNDITYKNPYGALYNYYVVNTGKLAPAGWHVPTDAEWEVLEGFVDTKYKYGDSEWDNILFRGYDAGKHLKSTSGWTLGGNGLDTYKFNVLPGGYRHVLDNFKDLGDYAGYWTSTPRFMRDVTFNDDRIWRYDELPNYGWFVRCVKD